jgi:hypothetical protein
VIDWLFISAREGGQALHGYVPKAVAGGDKSGVTIGDGIDLGYYENKAFETLPSPLQDRLLPYLDLIGARARAALAQRPLTVTLDEAVLIETPKRQAMAAELSRRYLRSAASPFESLPDAAQTVMMSVTWQYGTPWARCPHFWNLCCAQDWPAVHAELMHFGDAYASRRELEAAYLKHGLGL